MEKIDLLRRRIEDLRDLSKGHPLHRTAEHKAFDDGYVLALKHVLEMFDF